MGKLIVLISITPDGFADGQNVMINPEFYDFIHELMSESDIIAFGRQTFEMFQERWPKRLIDNDSPEWVRKMAKSLNDMRKIVFSSTLKNTTWPNTVISDQLMVDYIQELKRDNDKAILTFGSVSLIEKLTSMNMVDDYYFDLLPLLPGKGETRFFKKLKLETAQALKFVSSKNLPSGSHIIHYKNASFGE